MGKGKALTPLEEAGKLVLFVQTPYKPPGLKKKPSEFQVFSKFEICLVSLCCLDLEI